MWFSSIMAAVLTAIAAAAPPRSDVNARQATTASERLGLKWLGDNSSLPKILYAAGGYMY